MSFIYSATAPDGQVYRFSDRAAFKKTLRNLREQFPHGKTVIRAELLSENEQHIGTMQPVPADRGAA